MINDVANMLPHGNLSSLYINLLGVRLLTPCNPIFTMDASRKLENLMINACQLSRDSANDLQLLSGSPHSLGVEVPRHLQLTYIWSKL